MNANKEMTLNPRFVRLDASTVCQLKCPSCPTATGTTGKKLGVGTLKFEDFKQFLRRNPKVSHIELSNWGEVFLNKDFVKILAHAYRHNVCLYLTNGVNMNDIPSDFLEAVVKYKLREITCSIDGVSQESYARYRVNGDFDQVIVNIKEINRFKAKYGSTYPKLKWQFIAFGHNEHEITKAREIAKTLNMDFRMKLSWADLYDLPDFSPVKDKGLVSKESGIGVASRKEYLAAFGRDYVEHTCCWHLWNTPQINYDGRMLGCSVNYWGDFGNVFDKGLDVCMNNDKMHYAREMLMGKAKAREDIPCTTCKIYHRIKKDRSWVTEWDVKSKHYSGRRYAMFEHKILGKKGTERLVMFINRLRGFYWRVRETVKQRRLSEIIPKLFPRALPNQGYPLSIPLKPDEDKKCKQYPQFRGATRGLEDFSCHVSVLSSGHCPHPPHAHKEEEVLMMLEGEADLLLPLEHGSSGKKRTQLKPGEFVYYPAEYPHTLRSTGTTPAHYLMFKWYTPKIGGDSHVLAFDKFNIFDSFAEDKRTKGFRTNKLFEGPSTCLNRFQCHSSILEPKAGYKPHADSYDVAIVVLEGEIETLGRRYSPHSIIFHPAGKKHGINNPRNVPAKYIVFEFQK